jgi:CheY-like chemotaxis protein
VFAVTDTGTGIRPEDHEKVFEQFLQAGDTLTDKPRGTGLGLPISRQIVEHHGGRMWLESALGTGSTFSFSLPVAANGDTAEAVPEGVAEMAVVELRVGEPPVAATSDVAEAPDGVAEPPVGEPPVAEPRVVAGAASVVVESAAAGSSLPAERRRADLPFDGPERRRDGRPTVVLIEDDPATRELVRQAAEPCAVRLLEAGNGEDGLELVRSTRPNLVVLDIRLPGLNGFEVAERIRADPAVAAAPILMLTIVEDRERAERLGVDGYLTKPFDADRLTAQIAALLPARAAGSSDVAEAEVAAG